MKRHLVQILFVATLLCALFGPCLTGAKGQGFVHRSEQHQSCIDRYDGLLHVAGECRQRTQGSSLFQSSRTSQRVSSSRTVRTMPTHGYGPDRSIGRLPEDHLSNLQKYACLCLLRATPTVRPGSSSPRSYYVIALRRILC